MYFSMRTNNQSNVHCNTKRTPSERDRELWRLYVKEKHLFRTEELISFDEYHIENSRGEK